MREKRRFEPNEGDRLKVLGSKAGRPTFRPVSGGKLKCNQLPHLGPITARQAEALRNFCAPHGTRPPESGAAMRMPVATKVQAAPQPPLREVEIDRYGAVTCPGCYEAFAAPEPGPKSCPLCSRKFRAVARPKPADTGWGRTGQPVYSPGGFGRW